MANLGQKRISDLKRPASPDEFVDKLIKERDTAAKWYFPIDFCPKENPTDTDEGTKRLPVSRLALLTADTNLIPASMLPSYVSKTLLGNMEAPHSESNKSDNWVFTAKDGTKYACPNPGEGEKAPSIDVIYTDNDPDTDYYQYRFVQNPDKSAKDIGTFVPIPSTLMVINGEGTEIYDDNSKYTRQVNIVIGAPDKRSANSNILEIRNHKLIHTTSGVTAKSYGNPDAQSPKFGDTFNTVYGTVDTTGHITAMTSPTITIPKTPASSSAAGLVMVGSNADVKPIGSSASVGTKKNGDYIVVAAADHVHTAAKLQLIHSNVAGDVTYNGSADVTYDMNNILQTRLPSVAPASEDVVLTFNGTGAEWVSVDTLISPSAITCTGTETAVTGTSVTLPIVKKDAIGSLNVSGNSITGITAGKVYMVTYNIVLSNSVATPYMHNIGIKFDGMCSCHNLNGSYLGNQWITGSLIVKATGNTINIKIGPEEGRTGDIFDAGSWKASVNMLQVAEVK